MTLIQSAKYGGSGLYYENSFSLAICKHEICMGEEEEEEEEEEEQFVKLTLLQPWYEELVTSFY